MIQKSRDERAISGSRERAGDRAESQMSHYLARAFGASNEVDVIEDLRFQPVNAVADDHVQIDHLLIHPYGLVIVETKSVTSRIRVNLHQEWERKWGNEWKGMDSPVKQAERQAEALKELLKKHKTQLSRYILGLVQGGFQNCPIDVIVAISGEGTIEGAGRDQFTHQVLKSDMVVDRVRTIIDSRRKADRLLSKEDLPYDLKPEERARIQEFLRSRHVPCVQQGSQEMPPTPVDSKPSTARQVSTQTSSITTTSTLYTSLESAACSKCKSTNVSIVHAKYGYCYQCSDCSGFTSIDFACRACGAKARVRKAGPQFSRVCTVCEHEIVFFKSNA